MNDRSEADWGSSSDICVIEEANDDFPALEAAQPYLVPKIAPRKRLKVIETIGGSGAKGVGK